MARAVLMAVAWVGMTLSAGAVPVDDLSGRPVTGTRIFIGDQETGDSVLMDLLETRVGQPLRLVDVRESITHLYSLSRFSNIEVYGDPVASGVVLRYQLTPVRVVEHFVFRGELGLQRDQLHRVITDRYGAAPEARHGPEAAALLEEYYRNRGYLQARVQAVVEDEPRANRVRLVFEVQPGVRARIATIDVQDDSGSPEAALLNRLGLAVGQPYDGVATEEALSRHAERLRARGYYEARAEVQTTVREEGRLVGLVLVVSAGPLVKVVFEGDPLPPERQTELVPIAREGSVDEDLLEDSSQRIADYLHELGYWKATVDHTTTQTGGDLVIAFRSRRGRLYRVDRVDIVGNRHVPSSQLQSLLSVKPGGPFVESTLDREVTAITEYYRRQGFVDVVVKPETVEVEPVGARAGRESRLVRVRMVVTEGPRTVVGTVAIAGNSAIPEAGLRRGLKLTPGSPFYRPQLDADREAIQLEYLNLGYQAVRVEASAAFADDHQLVDLRYLIDEGSQSIVDHILVVGNNRISVETIRRTISLQPGQPLSLSAIAESQRRLSRLGLFRSVRINELPPKAGQHSRDVLIQVEEAPVTSIGYGGGMEVGRRLRRGDTGTEAVERLEFAPRGFFEVGRRNLWGKNRSVNLFMRASVRPFTSSPTTDGGGAGFTEYRLVGSYREPAILSSAAELVVTGFLEQGIRSSFNFSRRGARAELVRRLKSRVNLIGRYRFDRTRLFDEQIAPEDQLLIDRLFPQVRLSTVSSSLIRDTRDDALQPSTGLLLGADGEMALRQIGSEVGFAKMFLQGFVYRRLPTNRRLVFAAGARLGLARGFLRNVVRVDEAGNPELGLDGQPIVDEVRDLPASERFFAGGDTTVRGFALDRLGDAPTIDPDGFPKGGNALIVLNAELRVGVWRDLGAVVFLDAGNVFARVSDLDLTEIRPTPGFGFRYRSPVGPIRVDLGFNLDPRNFATGGRERSTTLHISIGQAF